MRKWVFLAGEAAAYPLLLPFFVWLLIPMPEYSRFTAPSQILSLVPGHAGVILRRVWYGHTLHRCGSRLTVDWLAVFRTRESEVGHRCTLGVANWVGWVRIGDDVMTGSHVVLLSGGHQHHFDDLDRPIREQGGSPMLLEIGDDVGIGASSIVMAAVSRGTLVGAGSVVTKTFPPDSVIAGSPARVIRKRGEPPR